MSSYLLNTIARRSPAIINNFRGSVRAFCIQKSDATKPDTNSGTNLGHNRTHKVDNFEKKMLVWTGKYKSADEIPTYINQDVMEKARNKIRIYLANIMMALTIVGCVIMIWSGKQAAERGETVQKQNLEWHKEYEQQAQQEALAKAQQNK